MVENFANKQTAKQNIPIIKLFTYYELFFSLILENKFANRYLIVCDFTNSNVLYTFS